MTKAEQLSRGKPKKPRTRKCLTCREWFKPKKEGVTTCSDVCATAYGISNFRKQANREKQKAKKEFNQNDTKWLTTEAQKAFNKYIRKRDEQLPCVSCGYVFSYLEGEPQGEDRQRQAGHLKTESKNALLRFNEDNVHSQCNHCNDPFWGLKGNVGEYEKNLRVRIGNEKVDKLFMPKVVKRWTVKELKEIIDTYKSKIRDLDE